MTGGKALTCSGCSGTAECRCSRLFCTAAHNVAYSDSNTLGGIAQSISDTRYCNSC